MYSVYKHSSPSNKVYIGITRMIPEKRWRNGEGYKHNNHFYSAILKYGWDSFKHEILFTGLTKSEAEEKEIELIALYKSTNREYGYNIESGGNAVDKIALESKQKMSLSHKGVPLSEKHIQGLRRGRKNRKIQPNTGKKLSDEWKKAVGESLSKPVIQYDLNGNYITSYNGQKQASKVTGVCGTNISRCCRGERKQAGGYLWGFTNDSKNK